MSRISREASGADTYDGGAGSDRIYMGLAWLPLAVPAEDAGFVILNSPGGEKDDHVYQPGSWTQEELDYMDDVIRAMHELKGNDSTIQKDGGGFVAWIRAGTYDGDAWGWNKDGVITLTDSTFATWGRYGSTIVHELGHNWDLESPYWDTFIAISGWTQFTFPGNPAAAVAKILAGWKVTEKYGETWVYNPAANFRRNYGRTHPKEDWCTSWEAYFFGPDTNNAGILDVNHAWMQANMPQKYALLHAFLS